MKSKNASRKKHHVIYKTTCLITGKYYIGMHSTDNLNDGYKGSGKYLRHSMNKHGEENHVVEILEHHKSRELLRLREEKIVTLEIIDDPKCMNLRLGGCGGIPGHLVAEETRLKLSKAGKGRKHSKVHCERISKSLIGRSHTEETKQKLRNRNVTEETKLKISVANTGRTQSTEERLLRSQAWKDKSAYNSKVIVIDGVEYRDAKKASSVLGISSSTISKRVVSCNFPNYRYRDDGKRNNKTSNINHSGYGTCWINLNGKAMKIKSDDLNFYLALGYKSGRR